MITSLTTLLGEYVPLNGEGIASLNPVWILGAVLLVMAVWVIFKIVLKLMDWMLR